MTKALLVIDIINDICNPKGKIASCAEHVMQQNAIENANTALAYARKNKWLVVLVKVGFEGHYMAQPKNSPIFGQIHKHSALKIGDFGTEFVEALDVQETDFVLVKPRISPFYATHLNAVLRANNVAELIVAGVSTAWAIHSTICDAHDRDYQVTVIEDACAASNKEEHDNAIKTLSRVETVLNSKELRNML